MRARKRTRCVYLFLSVVLQTNGAIASNCQQSNQISRISCTIQIILLQYFLLIEDNRNENCFSFLGLCSVLVHTGIHPACLQSCGGAQRNAAVSSLINWEMSDQIYLRSTNRKRGRVMGMASARRRTRLKTQLKVQSRNQQCTGFFSHFPCLCVQRFHTGTASLISGLILVVPFHPCGHKCISKAEISIILHSFLINFVDQFSQEEIK